MFLTYLIYPLVCPSGMNRIFVYVKWNFLIGQSPSKSRSGKCVCRLRSMEAFARWRLMASRWKKCFMARLSGVAVCRASALPIRVRWVIACWCQPPKVSTASGKNETPTSAQAWKADAIFRLWAWSSVAEWSVAQRSMRADWRGDATQRWRRVEGRISAFEDIGGPSIGSGKKAADILSRRIENWKPPIFCLIMF